MNCSTALKFSILHSWGCPWHSSTARGEVKVKEGALCILHQPQDIMMQTNSTENIRHATTGFFLLKMQKKRPIKNCSALRDSYLQYFPHTFSKSSWLCDSGAFVHMINDRLLFTELAPRSISINVCSDDNNLCVEVQAWWRSRPILPA